MENNLAESKYKQYICENSPELRDFERALQTAYNRHVLEAKIAFEHSELMKEKVVEKELAKIEMRQTKLEEQRLKSEAEKKRTEEKRVADMLQAQMYEKRKSERDEMERLFLERSLLQKELEQEKLDEKRAAEKKKIEKEQLYMEQMEFQKLQLKIKEEDQRIAALEEKCFQNEATCLASSDAAIVEERQKRIKAFEAVQSRMADQLSELARLQHEKEEIRHKLRCIEREELERTRVEEEEKLLRLRKEASKQVYEEITKEKFFNIKRTKEDDIIYAESVRQNLEMAAEEERRTEEERRLQRNSVREDNLKLIHLRRQRKAADLKAEKALALAEETVRAERERVVNEEKLRLLRSLDASMLRHLPRGSLTEKELLCLSSSLPGKA